MPSTAVLLLQRIKPFFPPFPTGLPRSSPILFPVLAPLPSVEVSTTKSTQCRRNEQAQNQRAHSTLEPQNARAPKPTLWHAKTACLPITYTYDSESTKIASIPNAKEILDSYNPSIQRDHKDIVKPALYAFLEFLPEDSRHELITGINKTGGNEETLYGVFDNLYTGLRSISEGSRPILENHRLWDYPVLSRSRRSSVTSPISKREQPEALSTSMHTPITRQEDF